MLSEYVWFYGVIFNTKEVMVILSNLCLQKPKNSKIMFGPNGLKPLNFPILGKTYCHSTTEKHQVFCLAYLNFWLYTISLPLCYLNNPVFCLNWNSSSLSCDTFKLRKYENLFHEIFYFSLIIGICKGRFKQW